MKKSFKKNISLLAFVLLLSIILIAQETEKGNENSKKNTTPCEKGPPSETGTKTGTKTGLAAKLGIGTEPASESASGSGNDLLLDEEDGVTKIPEIPGSFSFIQSLIALSFVLGLIFLATYLFKKITGIKSAGFGGNRVPINMIGNMALGEKKFLSIVEIQEKHYFLGITPTNISLLSELQLELQERAPREEKPEFHALLNKAKSMLNRTKENK